MSAREHPPPTGPFTAAYDLGYDFGYEAGRRDAVQKSASSRPRCKHLMGERRVCLTVKLEGAVNWIPGPPPAPLEAELCSECAVRAMQSLAWLNDAVVDEEET